MLILKYFPDKVFDSPMERSKRGSKNGPRTSNDMTTKWGICGDFRFCFLLDHHFFMSRSEWKHFQLTTAAKTTRGCYRDFQRVFWAFFQGQIWANLVVKISWSGWGFGGKVPGHFLPHFSWGIQRNRSEGLVLHVAKVMTIPKWPILGRQRFP